MERNLAAAGWIDDDAYGDLFQRVALNGGVSRITFSYVPVRGREACWGFGLGVLGLGLCLAMTLRSRSLRRTRGIEAPREV